MSQPQLTITCLASRGEKSRSQLNKTQLKEQMDHASSEASKHLYLPESTLSILVEVKYL